MKFLVDAQLPPALADWLGKHGHDAVHVARIGLLAASDRAIADVAIGEDRVLVSKDEDFLLLRLPNRFSLLWLRIGNAANRTLIAWLEPRWPEIERPLASGERLIEVR